MRFTAVYFDVQVVVVDLDIASLTLKVVTYLPKPTLIRITEMPYLA